MLITTGIRSYHWRHVTAYKALLASAASQVLKMKISWLACSEAPSQVKTDGITSVALPTMVN